MIFFKLPNENAFYTVEEGTGCTPVQFHPFLSGLPPVKFQGQLKILEESQLPELSSQILNPLSDFQNEQTREDYLKKVSDVIAFIKKENLKKLVLSRVKTLRFEQGKLDLSASFKHLSQNFPNALSYLFIRDGYGWMGAFSELLGKFHKKSGRFETMSLAGTLPINEQWSRKEIDEQSAVTDYIANVLANYADKVDLSPVKDHHSGNIKHLRTDFRAEIQAENLERLIEELHPTPAVCGFPKDLCLKAIRHFENHNRSLYSGYIKIENEDTIQYFVNLRCSELHADSASLYLGGGITAESCPEKEWRETELKSQAIAQNLKFG
ncbi:chorismate-binding protein [Bergeyella sp. RCAD1439]|uniref:chorismate-binding protein n=1 Tax=Bergeyella anatis TaxID=3113737 RepID=UPI002E1700C8|nr:chorismate-binding protein [Bergeyella sp. RCAD1439]